jgi:hypothetical protein
VLSSAVEALTADPYLPGAKARSEIGKHLFTLHVARYGNMVRHFVLFRVDAATGPRQIMGALGYNRCVPERPLANG